MELARRTLGFHGSFLGHKEGSMEYFGYVNIPWKLTPTLNTMEFHEIPTAYIVIMMTTMSMAARMIQGTWGGVDGEEL